MSDKSRRVGRVLRLALSIVALLVLAGLVPSERALARSGAQLAAVLVPLGFDLLLSRWSGRQGREKAIRELHSSLEPLTAKPKNIRANLDDPAYDITPYWGRTPDHRRLNEARSTRGHAVIIVSGGPWTGKTRLLIKWALELPTEVVAGWLPKGEARHVIQRAGSLGVPAVLLHQGDDADLADALTALAGAQTPITLVVERRDASLLPQRIRALSPTAGRLVDAASTLTIENPGSAADLDHRFGDMVVAYERAAEISRHGPPPRSPRSWTTQPIGLVSALAMLHALGAGSATGVLSPIESFARYWRMLCEPWTQERPAPRFGLPPLSDAQLETALLLHVLTGGDVSLAITKLPLFEKLGVHESQQLAAWAQEVTHEAEGRSTQLAAVAATQALMTDQQRTLGEVLRSVPRQEFVHAVALLLNTAQVLGETPTLARWVVGSDFASLRAVLIALSDEVVPRAIDILVAEQAAASALTLEHLQELLRHTTFDLLPNTHVALCLRALHALPSDFPNEKYALLLITLVVNLGELGRHREALPCAEEAVEVYRRLADPTTGDPERYDATLAGSLDALAVLLTEVGRREEALPRAEEAVEVYRRLADPVTGAPERYDAELAGRLKNLALFLAGVGRSEEALSHAEEAVEVYRRLANPTTGNPKHYDAVLADSLYNLAALLAGLGHTEEALPRAEEAVEVYRRLADPETGNPERCDGDPEYDSGRARALNNLALLLAEEGRPVEALPHAEEAVEVYRRLADPQTGSPKRYDAELAGRLDTLALLLAKVGLPRKALPPAQESVAMYRRLADPRTGSPKRYDAELAGRLNNLAVLLAEVGQPAEALPHTTEAVKVYRRLANPETGDPKRYGAELAGRLKDLAALLAGLSRTAEALPHAEEAVEVYRSLADPQTCDPKGYDADLADALDNLVTLLADMGRRREALPHAEEAVKVYRRLADPTTGEPKRYRSKLSYAERRARALRLGGEDTQS